MKAAGTEMPLLSDISSFEHSKRRILSSHSSQEQSRQGVHTIRIDQ